MNYYQGDAYLEQRRQSASDRVQARRASLFADISCDTILDFGCGTGGIVSCLNAKRKIGVEIGEKAAEIARSKGVEVFSSVADVPPVDVAISYHALEHVDDDVGSLAGIHHALKPGGRLRIVVPGELPIGKQRRWRENADKHLRTWTPLSLGNLAERAGFRDIVTRIEPPVSGSRGVRIFGKPYRYFIGLRDNTFNVILEARASA